MNDDARQGRRIILVVMAGLLIPVLGVLLIPGTSVKSQAVRLAIVVGMSFFMWRGYSWARSYIAFSLGVAALLAALSGVLAVLALSWGAVFLLLAPLYAWGAWALWRSPKVDAYIEHCERQRNPDMSFTLSGRGDG